MTLLQVEGYELNTDVNLADGVYEFVDNINGSGTGRLQGNSYAPSASTGSKRTRSFGLRNEFIYGFGFQYIGTTVFTDTQPQVMFMQGASEQFRMEFERVDDTSFRWVFYRGATQLGTTSAFTNLNWHYFELRVVIDPSSGEIEFRQNQQVDVNLSGLNTANVGTADADVVQWDTRNSQVRWDDEYLLDTLGTINNTFLGDSVIEGRLPTGDGTYEEWTLSNGSNMFALLDDTTGSSGASSSGGHITSDTVGQRFLLTFNALSFITGQIHAVFIHMRTRLDAVGVRDLKFLIRSNGTDYDGDTVTVNSTNLSTFTMMSETDPDTGSKWTIAAVDAAEFGGEVVS